MSVNELFTKVSVTFFYLRYIERAVFVGHCHFNHSVFHTLGRYFRLVGYPTAILLNKVLALGYHIFLLFMES